MAEALAWADDLRPREKLIKHGSSSLSDSELLAIFLRTGTRKQPVMALANQVLRHFDGLRGLLAASESEFCAQHGLGQTLYVQLQAALEINRRFQVEGLTRAGPLRQARDALELFRSHLSERSAEVFCCLWLDTKHRLLRLDEMFSGTIDGASVYPREVVRRALQLNAAAVIFAHNHPSGVAEPSRADRDITRRLQDALQLIEVRVLDHLVVGCGEHASFAERGWL
nr:DNA repair protein RadC [Oceanococcus sp. HetDA_MAG_MS8]